MSATKASQRLRAMAGANIAESIDDDTARGVQSSAILAPCKTDRYDGLNRVKGALQIPPSKIVADPHQPRKEFATEALERLASSLKARGQLQPIRVRWDEAMGMWVVIAGERRWRAARLAGLPVLAAIEASATQSPDEILEDQLVENCVREDLKPVEQAKAFRALMDKRGWAAVRIAESLNLAESSVARALSLLELPSTVQDRVDAGDIAPSVAYEISKAEGPVEQAELAERVVAERLTRAETVKARKSKGRGGKPKKETSRVYRVGKAKVTIECKAGLDSPLAIIQQLARMLRPSAEIAA